MSRYSDYNRYKSEGYTIYGRISAPNEEHTVEDARTPKNVENEKRRREPAERSDRKRHPLSKTGKWIFVVCLTLLAFSLSVIAADLITGNATLAEYVSLFRRQKESGETYYAVYASKSEDMGISYRNAEVIRGEGGAGYVIKSGTEYYVVVNVYESKEDAEKVTKKNAGYALLPLTLQTVDDAKYPALSDAENGKALCKKAYETLYLTSNEVAKGTYGASEMKKKLRPIREEIAAYEEKYRAAIGGKEDQVGIEYKVFLKEMIGAFDNLDAHEKDLVAEARYYAAMILHSYSLFSLKYAE